MPKPSYRKRSGYDRAIVTLNDSATKRRCDYWLGAYNTRGLRSHSEAPIIAEFKSIATGF
ncbi:MAG TPA: hypothetical protein ENJ00_03680 [Phycisphaerales bacterium]|nr:hypothetical protein [Phycisphaerales bacterium]